MCKHVAATLYGIGARFDKSSELLFLLRAVDHLELIAQAGKEAPRAKTVPPSKKVLADTDLSGIVGIEIAEEAHVEEKAHRRPTRKGKRVPG